MSYKNQNNQPKPELGPSRGKEILVKYIGTPALLLAVGIGAHQLGKSQQPEMTGEQTVQVGPGDTVDGLIKENVDGGASHTGDVRVEVMNDPDNADVFENGQLDPGEELELPEKVQ